MRVLVVEDSRTLADAVGEGLGDEGFAVDVAYDGLQAAAKLDLTVYDVVVLDRDLPGLSGDTVCRLIAEREAPAMVLMLTASGDPAQRVAGLALGADDYLSKPFHFPELVLRVRALARRRPTAHARVFRAAGIELSPLHHTATRHGRPLRLSAKEFAVLEALIRAPGVVLSAEALFAQVWDEHADPFSNTVHVTISRLRRKLGEPAAIETITSVGYRIARDRTARLTAMRDDVRHALEIGPGATLEQRTIDITTTGRRTGEPRRIEIVFYRFEDTIYLSGIPAPKPRGWLLNLNAEPQFTFHLKHGVVADLPAVASVISDPAERRRVLAEFVEQFNARQSADSPWPTAVLDEWVAGSPLAKVTFAEQ